MTTPTEDFQPYDRYLRSIADGDNGAQAIFELEEAVDRLAETPEWKLLCEIMAAGKASLVHELINGKTREQSEYARLAGFAAGLEQMPTAADAIRRYAARIREHIDGRKEADEVQESLKQTAPDGISPRT